MYLKRIIDRDEEYIVETEVILKFIGIRCFTWTKTYIKKKEDKKWFEIGSNLKISKRIERKLNYWIAQHEKFVIGQPTP